jgi:hypothetical protein
MRTSFAIAAVSLVIVAAFGVPLHAQKSQSAATFESVQEIAARCKKLDNAVTEFGIKNRGDLGDLLIGISLLKSECQKMLEVRKALEDAEAANKPADDYEQRTAQVRSQVAASFFDPGPSLVMKVLQKLDYYGYIDLGLNLTSLTEYQVGDILFPGGFQSTQIQVIDTKRHREALVQFVILRDIRRHFAKPANLQAVYGQVKSVAIPALLQKIGASRANTWLAPAEDLFVKKFDPDLGKNYESWRDGGCQWYLQVDPDKGYHPTLSKDECARHPFALSLNLQVNASTDMGKDGWLVNRAHWYGFLWRRYLEGDSGLVTVWQGILSDISKAARTKS